MAHFVHLTVDEVSIGPIVTSVEGAEPFPLSVGTQATAYLYTTQSLIESFKFHPNTLSVSRLNSHEISFVLRLCFSLL